MKSKKIIVLLVMISITFSQIGIVQRPTASAEESLDEILGEDLPTEISDDNLVIEEDDDPYGEYDQANKKKQKKQKIRKVSEEELAKALEQLIKKKIKVHYSITKKWNKHYKADITLTNISDDIIRNWEIRFPFPDKIESIQNARITKNENGIYHIKNAGSNPDLHKGDSVSFQMTVACHDNATIHIPEKCGVAKELDEVETEYDLKYKEYGRQGNKVSGKITVINRSNSKIEDWKLELETNLVFTEIDDAQVLKTDTFYCYLDNKGYNADIPKKSSVSFEFTAECDETPDIAEYYLYEMIEPVDEEDAIIFEVKEGKPPRDDEDFDTDKEYQAYLTVRDYYAAKSTKGQDTPEETKKPKETKKPEETKKSEDTKNTADAKETTEAKDIILLYETYMISLCHLFCYILT